MADALLTHMTPAGQAGRSGLIFSGMGCTCSKGIALPLVAPTLAPWTRRGGTGA